MSLGLDRRKKGIFGCMISIKRGSYGRRSISTNIWEWPPWSSDFFTQQQSRGKKTKNKTNKNKTKQEQNRTTDKKQKQRTKQKQYIRTHTKEKPLIFFSELFFMAKNSEHPKETFSTWDLSETFVTMQYSKRTYHKLQKKGNLSNVRLVRNIFHSAQVKTDTS